MEKKERDEERNGRECRQHQGRVPPMQPGVRRAGLDGIRPRRERHRADAPGPQQEEDRAVSGTIPRNVAPVEIAQHRKTPLPELREVVFDVQKLAETE